MRRLVPILAAGLMLAAPSFAAAQSWGDQSWGDQSWGGQSWGGQSWGGTYDHGYGRRGAGWNAVPSAFDWRGQLDRPGDYRCDRFWDASRTDCDARGRDQRDRVSYQARRDYRALAGDRHDGYGHAGYGRYGYRDGYGRASYGRRGYGAAHDRDGTAYYGAYGRPDLVYPEGRRGSGQNGYGQDGYGSRDPRRIDWCRASYRSYDPSSGYYRAYSGRLIFCG